MEAFIKFMTAFASSVWNWLFIIAFIGACLYFYRQFMARIAGKINQLEQSKAILEKYNAENIHFNYEPFKAEVKKDELLAGPWAKYEKTILLDVHHNPAMVYSTVDAEEYFNAVNLSGGMNVGYLSGFAGVFTGIGILGTFLGLTVGLAGIDTTSTNTLSSSISSLLSGMSTAFVTSLLGIVCAIPCGYLYSQKIELFKTEVAQVAAVLDTIFVRRNLEEIMLDQVAESRAQRVALESLSTDMANAICGQLPDILGRIADRIDSSLQGNLGNLSTKLDVQSTELQKQTTHLANVDGALSGGALSTISKAFEGATKGGMANLNSSLKNLATNLDDVATKLDEMIDKYGKTGDDANKEMIAAVKEAVKELKETTQNIMGSLTREMDANIAKMTASMDSMKNTVEEICNKMQQQQRKTDEGTAGTIGQVNNTIEQLMEKLSKQMEKMQTMLKDHEERFQKTLDDMNKAVKSSSVVVDKAGEAAKTFDQTIDHTSERLETAATTAANAIEGSVEPFKKAVQPLQQSITDMADNMKALKVYNENTVATMEQMKSMVHDSAEASRDIQIALQVAENSWKAYETHFNGVNEGMARIFKQLEEGLDGYNRVTNEGLEKKLQLFDKSMATAIGKLAALHEEQNELLDDLNDALNRTRR